MAFRSVTAGGAFAPFGPHRTAAAPMIAAGATMETFLPTLEALEAARLLSADLRSVGDLPEPAALRALRLYAGRSAVGSRRPAWYGEDSAVIYDEVRDLPTLVTGTLREIIAELCVHTCAELCAHTCAELGCGTGRLSLAIASPLERIYAVDSSPEMLARLREKDREGGAGRIVPVLASMGTTGLPDGSVDVVAEFEAFFFFPNPARLSREIARILSPSGTALRLVKVGGGDPHAEEILRRFDEAVAARSPDGICFVGESVNTEIDAQLESQGIRTVCFEIFTAHAERTVDELLTVRRQRAFPYLEHVPETVLREANAVAREEGAPETVRTRSVYYLLAGFRGSEAGQVELLAQLLDRLLPAGARRVPGVPDA